MADSKISALTSYTNPDPVNDVVVCEICSYSYKTYPSWAKTRRTCSRVCAAKLKSIEKRGENASFYGKQHTLETKQKISENRKGKNRWFGVDNPAYGKPAWNKGIKTGVKSSSIFIKGTTPWNKGIKFLAISGSNHHSWKGGITPVNHKIRTSSEYKKWRITVFERDNYTCVFCGTRGGDLEADHIKQFAYHPELRLDINNGRTLCKNCHKMTNTHSKKIKVLEKQYV